MTQRDLVHSPHDDDGNDLDPAVAVHPNPHRLPTREREFYTSATNLKGVSVRAQCRVTPEVMRVASDLHASRAYPFRVVGDLFRWCIERGLKELCSGAGIKSVWAQAEIIKQMNMDEAYNAQFEEVFRGMEPNVQRYLARGEVGRCRKYLWGIKESIQDMPNDDWKTQYWHEFLRRYGNILDGGSIPGPGAVLSLDSAKSTSTSSVPPTTPAAPVGHNRFTSGEEE